MKSSTVVGLTAGPILSALVCSQACAGDVFSSFANEIQFIEAVRFIGIGFIIGAGILGVAIVIAARILKAKDGNS